PPLEVRVGRRRGLRVGGGGGGLRASVVPSGGTRPRLCRLPQTRGDGEPGLEAAEVCVHLYALGLDRVAIRVDANRQDAGARQRAEQHGIGLGPVLAGERQRVEGVERLREGPRGGLEVLALPGARRWATPGIEVPCTWS